MNRIFSDDSYRRDTGGIDGDELNEPFRAAFAATVGVLTILCGVFLGLGYFQAPRITEASIDIARSTFEPGQQLRLFVNGPVADVEASSVEVTPEVPFTVSTSGDLIAVQFDLPLHFNTDYVVEIADVTSSDRGGAGTIRHEFSTGSSDVVYLDRGISPGEPDRILSTPLIGSGATTLYSNDSISDFAVLENSLVVSRTPAQASDGSSSDGSASDEQSVRSSSLEIASLVETASESIVLPGRGMIDDLRVAAGTSRVAFTLTSSGPEVEREFDRALMSVDFDGSRTVEPVIGLDGEPLSVLSWSFMPGSSLMLVQLRDQSVFLVDPTGVAPPSPLGSLAPVGRLSMDGSTLVIVDPFGSVVVSLRDGTEYRLEPSLVEGEVPFVGDVQPLVNGSLVQRVAILDPDTGRFASMLVIDDGTAARVLYATVDSAGSIVDFALSPNEQFVAVEVVPVVEGSESDGRAVRPRATTVTTVIVEISTGETVRSFEGFAPKW